MRRRRADDLFDRIATFEALCAAALRSAAAKRRVPGPAAFLANLETEVLSLERELRAGTWRPGGYVSFEVHAPKRRLISAAPFRDRVVHHALHAVIAPLFERGFIGHSYANRVAKGTHRAVTRYERLRDRHRYVLRGDVFRYSPAIDHEILKTDLRRRIRCRRTLAVLDRIVDSSNPQEPVHLYYPGDDLFTPYERRRGLPIGNLTSQLFANIYLDRFDHFVTEVLRAPYLRYVDDFALFADDRGRLEEWRDRAGGLSRPAPPVAASAEDACGAGGGAGDVSRLRAAAGRPSPPAGGERATLPQPPARAARPLAGGERLARGCGTARHRLGGARGACRHVAAAPCDLPGWVVRTARTAGPGGLTGPLSPCVAGRFLEQQSGEPAFGESQQQRCRRAQRQQRLSCVEHAPLPEPARSGPPPGAHGCVQGRS